MRALALALLVALPLIARAQVGDPEAVRAVLEPALVAAGLDTTLALVESTLFDREEPATAAFSRDRMRPLVLAAFLDGTTLEEARAFAAWTQRPDVAPFLARERATGHPDYDARVDAFFDAETAIDGDRVDATIDLLDRTGYIEYATESGLLGSVMIATLFEPEDAKEPIKPGQIDRLVEDLRALRGGPMRDAMEATLTDTYYVAFADLPLAALHAYLDAVDRPEAQWYFERLADAHLGAFGAALREMIEAR